MNNIETPCILVCVLEQNSGHCYGCGRTRDEIADWTKYDDQQRSHLMQELPTRVAKLERKPRRITKRRRLARQNGQTIPGSL